MFDRILVPLDGSPESQKIRHWVVGIAAELESAVDLLGIVDPTRLKRSDDESLLEAEIAAAHKYLRTQADWFQERDVTVATHVVKGDPAEAIIEQARELDSRLIAMVTQRRSAIMRGVLGSVSDRVLHSTGVPIMLVRPGDDVGFVDGAGLPSTVIVPLDGSDFAEGAIPFAEALAKHSTGQVLYVSGTAPNSSYAAYSLADPAISMDDDGKTRRGSYLEKVAARSNKRGITATQMQVRETAAEAIIKEASRSSDRLIVMTSHGASGIKRWLLGSVADKVIRSSKHPVIVIPPEHQQVAYRGGTRRMP